MKTEVRNFVLRRIISGGQTGADQGGLRAAQRLGLETGGFAPKGWITESGPQPALLRSFGLIETAAAAYPVRTLKNVRASDGTLIVGRLLTPGSSLTRRMCGMHSVPFFHVPFPGRGGYTARGIEEETKRLLSFRDWLERERIEVLNVAGNRESTNPGVGAFTETYLWECLSPFFVQQEET